MLVGLIVVLVFLYAIVVAVLFYLAVTWRQEKGGEEISAVRLHQIRAEARSEAEKDYQSRLGRAREEARAEAELAWDNRARKIQDDAREHWEKRIVSVREEARLESARQWERQVGEIRAEERARAMQEWQTQAQRMREEVRVELSREWEERLRQLRAELGSLSAAVKERRVDFAPLPSRETASFIEGLTSQLANERDGARRAKAAPFR